MQVQYKYNLVPRSSGWRSSAGCSTSPDPRTDHLLQSHKWPGKGGGEKFNQNTQKPDKSCNIPECTSGYIIKQCGATTF